MGKGYNKTLFTKEQALRDTHFKSERIKALKLKPTYRPQDGQVIVTYVDHLNRPYFYVSAAWRMG